MATLSLTRNYDRIFSIMRDEFQADLWDNVSARTAYLFRLKQMGAIIEMGGRPHLRFNIMKALPTTEAYTDLGILTAVRADPVTSIVFEWKQLNTPVQISGLDMIKTGDGAEPQMLQMFIEAAEISMRDTIGGSSIGLFSDGNESDLDKISGLQTFLTSTPTTGTVGQLDRANETNWRHQTADVSGDFSANGLARLRTLFRQVTRHDEVPDSIVVNGATMDNYENALTSTFQVNLPLGDSQMIDAGFANIRYKGALMFVDDGVPANRGYVLNIAKFLRLIVRSGRNAEIGEFVKSREQDDLATFVLWAGNQIITNLGRNGVLLNTDTD